MQDVQGDTVFGLMLKMASTLEANLEAAVMSEEDEGKIRIANARFRAGIHLLAEELPTKALDTPDFKCQTPLILAADQGDTKLVSILLDRKVGFDAQDLWGRTALHAAAASRSSECYLLLLQKGANAAIKTVPPRPLSALSSAVRFGLPQAVKATLEMQGSRFRREQIEEILLMVHDILGDYDGYRRGMGEKGRQVGPRSTYQMIEGVLSHHLG